MNTTTVCVREIFSLGFLPESDGWVTGEREEFPYTPIAEVRYGGNDQKSWLMIALLCKNSLAARPVQPDLKCWHYTV